MRIVWLHTDLRLYWPARLAGLNAALRARGDELHVIEVATAGSPYDFEGHQSRPDWSVLFQGRDIHTLAPRQVTGAVMLRLNEVKPDIVAAGGIAFSSGAAAVRWCRDNHRGVVIFDDARIQDVPRSSIVNMIKRRIYMNVDAMFVPAMSHLETCATWGFDRERVFFGVDVVDNAWFAAHVKDARANCDGLRASMKLPARFFLGVGRLIAKKNWSALIAAYARYLTLTKGDALGLVFVGDGPERERLESYAVSLGLSDVRFAGTVVGAALCDYYGLAECFVLPSYGETWGLVVNEAMACGLPVLVSDRCGCAKTLVEEGVNGWTFSPADSDGLARLMLRVASQSQNELMAMGRESERIISDWSLDRFVSGAVAAIDACRDVRRGYRSLLDRAIINLWNGRYRPV